MKAKVWDEVGPRKSCLLRVVQRNVAEWLEFEFLKATPGTVDEYMSFQSSLCLLNNGLGQFWPENEDEVTVTHYADLPEIDE